MYAPIINFLSDGVPHKRKEIKDSLVAVFSLTLDEQIMQSGVRGKGIFDAKVNDALFYLIKTGMIEQTDTTIFRITDIGMKLWDLKIKVVDDEILTKYGNGFKILGQTQDNGRRPAPSVQKVVHERVFPPSRPNASPLKSPATPLTKNGTVTRAPEISIPKKDLDFRKIINTSRQGPWRQRVERFTEAYGSKLTPVETDAINRITKNKDKNLPLGSEDVKLLYLLFEKLHEEDAKNILTVLFIDEKGQDVPPKE